MIENSDVVVYPSGAQRSADADSARYDLLPLCAVRRWAERMAHGARKHGDDNWKRGFPAGVVENHLWNHWLKYLQGDRTDDHLAAILCNAAFLMWFEDRP